MFLMMHNELVGYIPIRSLRRVITHSLIENSPYQIPIRAVTRLAMRQINISLTKHFGELSIVHVRVDFGQFLSLYSSPDHKRVHWPSDSLRFVLSRSSVLFLWIFPGARLRRDNETPRSIVDKSPSHSRVKLRANRSGEITAHVGVHVRRLLRRVIFEKTRTRVRVSRDLRGVEISY